MTQATLVSYLRASANRQGHSGFSVEAQREAVAQWISEASGRLVAEVVEVESGKRNDRPELAEALRLCRLLGATLIIAKLDNLARNVAVVSRLMESGVEFTACDFPQANKQTVHILAAVADHEAKAISERTKAALAAAKRRGRVLGGFRGTTITAEARQLARAAITTRTGRRAADLAPVIAELRARGITSLNAIAKVLTDRGIPTARGLSHWSPAQVSRVIAQSTRHGEADAHSS